MFNAHAHLYIEWFHFDDDLPVLADFWNRNFDPGKKGLLGIFDGFPVETMFLLHTTREAILSAAYDRWSYLKSCNILTDDICFSVDAWSMFTSTYEIFSAAYEILSAAYEILSAAYDNPTWNLMSNHDPCWCMMNVHCYKRYQMISSTWEVFNATYDMIIGNDVCTLLQIST